MSDIDKGFYFSIHQYFKGPAYQAFLEIAEKEVLDWVQSDAGKEAIRWAVADTVKKEINSLFNWYAKDDPRAERFQAIVKDALFKELFRSMGVEESGMAKVPDQGAP